MTTTSADETWSDVAKEPDDRATLLCQRDVAREVIILHSPLEDNTVRSCEWREGLHRCPGFTWVALDVWIEKDKQWCRRHVVSKKARAG